MGYTRMKSYLTTVSQDSFIIVILEKLNENKIIITVEYHGLHTDNVVTDYIHLYT